jgi:hypothetical protein
MWLLDHPPSRMMTRCFLLQRGALLVLDEFKNKRAP